MRPMFYQDDKIGKPSGHKCPITGSDLIYDGYDFGTLDGDSYYHSEADPNLKWVNNRRSFYWELRSQEETWWMTHAEIVEIRRYFKQSDSGEWQEYFAVNSTPAPRFFPIGTSFVEVNNILKQDIEEKKRRDEEYRRKVESGEIEPLMIPITKVEMKPISSDSVEVKPMLPPTGIVFHVDFKLTNHHLKQKQNMNKLELLNSEGPILTAHKVEGNADQFLVEDQAGIAFNLTREELENFVNGTAMFADSIGKVWDYEGQPQSMKPAAQEIEKFLSKGSL